MTPSARARTAVLQGLIALAVVAPVVACAAYVWHKHQWATAQLAQLEPRYARLLGLRSSHEAMQQASATAAAQLTRYAYPSSQDAIQAGNDAQQRIRTLFADSKLDIGSIQVLPPKTQESFDRIGVTLRVEGDLVGLQNALSLLEAQTPTVWVDSITIQNIGHAKPKIAQRLAAQLSFSVLRARAS